MSDENVEIILETTRLFDAGDFNAARKFLHPDSVLTPPDGWPEAGPFIGRDAVIAQYEQIWAQFEAQAIKVKNVAARGDWVILDYEWKVRGAGSGVDVEFDVTAVSRFEGGLIREAHHRWDHDKAIEAAGLSE